jgi:transitional endoplasmic reticulum ATPase
MHTLSIRENPVVSLYVKAIRATWQISQIFQLARQMAPCLLILEDIDTLVTEQLRSYFFNEVDGLENNNGILMIATTNHLDRLDGGLVKRPSRFDRKYNFPAPNRDQRILYCEYWRRKLQYKKEVEFPEKLSPAIADITKGFTFAYLKEAFVASLLAIARRENDSDDEDEPAEIIAGLDDLKLSSNDKPTGDDKDITNLPLWIEIQEQVKTLREDMNSAGVAAKKDQRSMLPYSIPPPPVMPPYRDDALQAPLSEAVTKEKLMSMRTRFNTGTPRDLPRPATRLSGQGGDSRIIAVTDLFPQQPPSKA